MISISQPSAFRTVSYTWCHTTLACRTTAGLGTTSRIAKAHTHRWTSFLRNQVIRQKSLLIGCGGGFQQECSQQFSPVADWMGSVDLFLEDEGQQYGNMEEAASVARSPAACLEVWSGDHRQTPGGLKKSKESKAFRKKLTKRPLALRCQTQYIQAHDFGEIVMRYLDCPKDSFAWKLQQLLTDGSAAIDPAVGQFWHELIGDSPPCLSK